VLALEASRLARNNRDWHHLIDLCAMAGTLVIDHDGVYDPGLLNDRLLLGLKRHDSQSTSCSTFLDFQQI
jgi:DNA invertase Pin-like site-specific DNA recombinase